MVARTCWFRYPPLASFLTSLDFHPKPQQKIIGVTNVKVLVCAGGTGGGVYPALATLTNLRNRYPDIQPLWVGGIGGMEAELVRREQIPYQEIPAAGLHGVNVLRLPKNLLTIYKGIQASKRILADFKPDVLFFTGGFVAFPMAYAGRAIPSVVFVPDIEPGMALRSLEKDADHIALLHETSRQYFADPDKCVVTGYPLRQEMRNWTAEECKRTFNLKGGQKVLLVFGGSKGARSINRAVMKHIKDLLTHTEIIHITGQLDWEEVEAFKNTLPSALKTSYHIYPYLHEEMAGAFSAADLVLSRAGASILGEFPEFGLPAILVPYPYAWRYQKVNADVLVKAGAAKLLPDERLENTLAMEVKALVSNPAQLNIMRNAMRAMRIPNAAESIADLLYSTGAKV